VWSGDLGGTEPSDPTRRYGLDLDWQWNPRAWLGLDANVALGRSTFLASRGNGGALALAPRIMGGGGVTVRRGTSFAALRFRGIGDRPANDDGSLTAQGFGLVDVVAQHAFGATTVGLSVENLLDADWREAQLAEESRVAPTADLVEDVHFTPGAPLTALVTLSRSL
jgi:outer membrane receptor protein involved in Fe transport